MKKHKIIVFAIAFATLLLVVALLAPPLVEAAPDSPPEIAIASFTSAHKGVDLAEDGADAAATAAKAGSQTTGSGRFKSLQDFVKRKRIPCGGRGSICDDITKLQAKLGQYSGSVLNMKRLEKMLKYFDADEIGRLAENIDEIVKLERAGDRVKDFNKALKNLRRANDEGGLRGAIAEIEEARRILDQDGTKVVFQVKNNVAGGSVDLRVYQNGKWTLREVKTMKNYDVTKYDSLVRKKASRQLYYGNDMYPDGISKKQLSVRLSGNDIPDSEQQIIQDMQNALSSYDNYGGMRNIEEVTVYTPDNPEGFSAYP